MRRMHEAYNYRRLLHIHKVPGTVPPHAFAKPKSTAGITGGFDRLLSTWSRMTDDEREKRLLQMGKAERVLQYLPTTTRRYYVDGDGIALRRNELGLKYLEMGDIPKAFRNFTEAIAQDPELGIAYNNVGMLYLEIGDLERAEHHFAEALRINEELDIAHGNLGLVRTEKGEYEAAHQSFEAAIHLDPLDPLHQNNMGILLLELGLPVDAMEFFTQAIDLDPGNPVFWNNRGLALNEIGRPSDANHDFERAIKLEEEQFQQLTDAGDV